ncbi:serine/threonine-protein kinase [Streptomyces sp. NPDC127084]|uniref:serine/threonine-protein kinase n=1 Tax=Streptomyces sp. NPDC127084 TaxID=3347133 RepID=UPI00364E45EB
MAAGRYQLNELIGRGAMGAVWAARDVKLERAVAVKEIRARVDLDPEEWRRRAERALREARAAALVQHRNVVGIHDVVMDDDRPWIIMELVTGRSLAEELTIGRMAVGDAARIAREALEGLIAAHASGVVHRDVKPSNLLLARPDGRTVLTDFGIAAVTGADTLTVPGSMIGTLDYLSPERVQGLRAVPACDLWSLGATLYEMVEGRSPFRRNSEFATLQAVLDGTYEPPRHAGRLGEVIDGLLTKDPAQRITASTARSLLVAAEREADTQRPHEPLTLRVTTEPIRTATAARGSGDRQRSGSGTGSASEQHPPTEPQGDRHRPGRPAETAPVPPEATDPTGTPGRASRRRWIIRTLIGATAIALAAAGVYAIPPLLARQSPTPRGSQAASPESPAAAARPGFRAISDPAGFTVEIGEDWTGPYANKRRVFYYSADKAYGLGVHLNPPDGAGDPYAELSAQDNDGTGRSPVGDYPQYRRISLERLEHNGASAALWEFTWYDAASDSRRRSIDLRYTKNGRTYDFWVAGPESAVPDIRKYFEAARETFSPTRTEQG